MRVTGLEEALAADNRSSQTAVVLEQTAEGAGRFVLVALLCPLFLALLVPFWMILSRLVSDAAARDLIAHRPLLALQLALGLIVLIGIFGWPLTQLGQGLLRRRRVAIENGVVVAEQVGLIGGAGWVEPLAAYKGLARRFRTTLSGAGEELILVHEHKSRSVVLLTAPRIGQDTMEAAIRLFALAEIPSREPSNVSHMRSPFRPAEPQTRLSAATA